ncbi:hypothetical protein ACH5RR_021582 [Cinchona calisaya]|uniref:Secreted protein n=1 Tax=Cinchona calisaya TaxID=153742 RepID=A0ABD2ZJ00_9GENT
MEALAWLYFVCVLSFPHSALHCKLDIIAMRLNEIQWPEEPPAPKWHFKADSDDEEGGNTNEEPQESPTRDDDAGSSGYLMICIPT